MKLLAPTLALLVAALAGGCSDPANTQYLPIGSRCSSGSQCGTSPYDCAATGYPFGYCEEPCTTNGDCPLDSFCAPAPVNHCRRVCTDDSACRVSDGYRCLPVAGVVPPVSICEPGPSVDGGTPSG